MLLRLAQKKMIFVLPTLTVIVLAPNLNNKRFPVCSLCSWPETISNTAAAPDGAGQYVAFFTFVLISVCGLWLGYKQSLCRREEKLRLRIARDLHDEMGSTLSSISILSEAALRHLQADIDRARFGAIGERARQVMEAMSDIVWSVNPRNDNMANVLQRMKQFAVEILEPQDIALHFEADEAAAALHLPMEQRKDFYLLFKEAVNNAAKYSGARDVWVTVQVNDGRLTLEVRDNGQGFDPATVKRGNGLWNMQKRAERMGGQFLVESKDGEGTLVKVKM